MDQETKGELYGSVCRRCQRERSSEVSLAGFVIDV